ISIYQSRIATVHEFIADSAVVQVGEKRSYYEQFLNSAFNTQHISFINQFFNHSLSKKRIIMLQKSRSKSISKFKYLFMFPLMVAMLTIVSCSQESPELKNKEDSLTEHLRMVNESLRDGEELTEQEYIILLELREHIKIAMHKNQQLGKFPDTDKLSVTKQNSDGADVPFAVVEQVPVYPGCEDLSSNEERKKCMSN